MRCMSLSLLFCAVFFLLVVTKATTQQAQQENLRSQEQLTITVNDLKARLQNLRDLVDQYETFQSRSETTQTEYLISLQTKIDLLETLLKEYEAGLQRLKLDYLNLSLSYEKQLRVKTTNNLVVVLTVGVVGLGVGLLAGMLITK